MESTESTISTPRSAIFEFWNLDTNEHLTLNHLLLTFKMYIYNARTSLLEDKSSADIYEKHKGYREETR